MTVKWDVRSETSMTNLHAGGGRDGVAARGIARVLLGLVAILVGRIVSRLFWVLAGSAWRLILLGLVLVGVDARKSGLAWGRLVERKEGRLVANSRKLDWVGARGLAFGTGLHELACGDESLRGDHGVLESVGGKIDGREKVGGDVFSGSVAEFGEEIGHDFAQGTGGVIDDADGGKVGFLAAVESNDGGLVVEAAIGFVKIAQVFETSSADGEN